jgi:hypothetical protein
MSNNFEKKRQSADSRSKMPEPIKLSSQEKISQAKDEADIDQAITEKNKEEALKSKFLQDEAEAKDRQEKGQPLTAYSQYKLAIMEELLKNKAVDFPKVVRQLKDADQPADFNLADCYEAFEMIRYYSNNPQELAGDYKTERFIELSQDPAQYVEDVANLINKISQYKQNIIKREAELGVPASKHDRYRLAILDRLLKENKVDVPKLAREMQQVEGDQFDLEAFKDAYLILDRENKISAEQPAAAETAEMIGNPETEEGRPASSESDQSAEQPDSPEAVAEAASVEDLEEAVIQKMPDQPQFDLPRKETRGKIIANFLYKAGASLAGVKSIIDWVGAGLGKLGLKIGQRTDVYKYFEQKKETTQDRGQFDQALEKLIEAATVNHQLKQEIYQDQRYIDLVAEIGRLQDAYNQESDEEVKAILVEEIKKNNEAKKKIAEEYRQAPEKLGLRQLAIDYNKLIDNARSADYYDLPKDQRQKIDDNWDKLSAAEKQLYALAESDKRTMKIRLGQILIGNLNKKDDLAKRQNESIQGVLSDYIHGKVEASTLLKDGLNTVFTLAGAGVARGVAYGTMAMIERAEVKDREFRKEYSWNKIGEKLSGSRQLMDLFVVSMKETCYGLSGRRFSQKYSLGEDGKLQRTAEHIKLTGLEGFAARVKALGEIVRLLGIGSQTVGAAINDGASLEKSLENIASTFKGDVWQNMLDNWYKNFRLDQRLTRSLKILQGHPDRASQAVIDSTVLAGVAQEGPAMNIDLNNLEDLNTDEIAWLAERGHPVSNGGSLSEALGRSVSGQESVLMINLNSKGEPIIYDGYDPNIVAPGARVIDYNGRLVVVDSDPAHLNFYEQHYFDSLSQEISNKIDSDLKIEEQNLMSPDNDVVKEVVAGASNRVEPIEQAVNPANHPYFDLAAKDISYEDLANGDAQVYQDFISANRLGGLQAIGENSDQDLGDDIDRIYHNSGLSIEDRIKILTGIKQEMNNPEMIARVASPNLRDHVAGIYQRYSDVIDHNIELLKHPDGTPVPQEWNGGLDEFVQWRDAGRPTGETGIDGAGAISHSNNTEDVFGSMDGVDNIKTALTNPNSSFNDMRAAIFQAIPEENGQASVGTLEVVRQGDQLYVNNKLFNQDTYRDVLFGHADLLNRVVNSQRFQELVSQDQIVGRSLSNITGQFNEVGASIRASNDFLNPNVSFDNKIDSLKAVMPDNSTMAVNGLTFLRSNDRMYLRLANNKVVALSSPDVVNRLLQARRAALAEIAN